MTLTERITSIADEIESWLRSNGAMYLTTARHAIRWPVDASAGDFTAAMHLLIEQGRIVRVDGGVCDDGYRVPGVWPEWIDRVGLGLADRMWIGRCKRADAQAVPA